jgi:hypothetical protein
MNIPSDILFLLNNINEKQKELTSVLQKKKDLENTYSLYEKQTTNKLASLDSENKLLQNKIKELTDENDSLRYNVDQLQLKNQSLEQFLMSKEIQYDDLKINYMSTKQTLKDTLERNKIFVVKLNELQEKNNQQYQFSTKIIEHYKSKIKLQNKPNITK